MIPQQMYFSYTGQGHDLYHNPGQQSNFSWQHGASQNREPSFLVHSTQPKLSFMEMLHLPDLSILLNDPIFYDPHCPLHDE
jgi:hypothetical protein